MNWACSGMAIPVEYGGEKMGVLAAMIEPKNFNGVNTIHLG